MKDNAGLTREELFDVISDLEREVAALKNVEQPANTAALEEKIGVILTEAYGTIYPEAAAKILASALPCGADNSAMQVSPKSCQCANGPDTYVACRRCGGYVDVE